MSDNPDIRDCPNPLPDSLRLMQVWDGTEAAASQLEHATGVFANLWYIQLAGIDLRLVSDWNFTDDRAAIAHTAARIARVIDDEVTWHLGNDPDRVLLIHDDAEAHTVGELVGELALYGALYAKWPRGLGALPITPTFQITSRLYDALITDLVTGNARQPRRRSHGAPPIPAPRRIDLHAVSATAARAAAPDTSTPVAPQPITTEQGASAMPTPVTAVHPRFARAVAEPEPGVVVLDTDIGYDPDDFVALILAARLVPRGQLIVVTADEVAGLRAELARRVLAMLGRDDVTVVEGMDLGHAKRRFLPDPGQTLPACPYPGIEQRRHHEVAMVDILTDLIESATGPVRWVGCGPMTNLAALLTRAPEYAEHLQVTQMGGWLTDYRDPTRSSHNFHTDQLAAGIALRMLPTPGLVMSEHTNHPDIRVAPGWALIHALDADSAPDWARLLGAHFGRWFAQRDGSWMHDPLTLAAALGYEFTTFTRAHLRIGEDVRLYHDSRGRVFHVSDHVDYQAFLDWMHQVVTW